MKPDLHIPFPAMYRCDYLDQESKNVLTWFKMGLHINDEF